MWGTVWCGVVVMYKYSLFVTLNTVLSYAKSVRSFKSCVISHLGICLTVHPSEIVDQMIFLGIRVNDKVRDLKLINLLPPLRSLFLLRSLPLSEHSIRQTATLRITLNPNTQTHRHK